MLFSELFKIMVKKVFFVGFRGAIDLPLDPPLNVREVSNRDIINVAIVTSDCLRSAISKFPPFQALYNQFYEI